MTTATLVIPSRGGAKRLPVLFEALRRQTHKDWNAIVVIDGDIDGSEAVANSFASDLPITVITFPENQGRVAALNAGFEQATGDILIRVDDDLEPAPEFVARHITANYDAPGGAIGLYKNEITPNHYAKAYGYAADEDYRRGGYAAGPENSWRYWAGNCSVSREVWQAVGPYDIRYKAYGWEDVDYGYRLMRHGYPVTIVRELETTHHAAATTTQSRVKRAYRSGQARKTFDDIHGVGASGPWKPQTKTAWNALVLGMAKGLSFPRSQKLSRGVDLALPRLPKSVGAKCVALLVEASSIAGYKEGPHDSIDF